MKTIMNLILVVIVVLFVVSNVCVAEIVQGDEIKVESEEIHVKVNSEPNLVVWIPYNISKLNLGKDMSVVCDSSKIEGEIIDVPYAQTDSSSVTSFKEFRDNVQPNQELVEVLKDINSTLKGINENISFVGFILLLILVFKNCSK